MKNKNIIANLEYIKCKISKLLLSYKNNVNNIFYKFKLDEK